MTFDIFYLYERVCYELTKSVIIVGAGIGGLATAAKLLSKDYKVTIYEKNSTIGGKLNFIKTDNFKFDLTGSILMTPEIYKEVFSFAGKNYIDYFKLKRLDPLYRAFYCDGSHFDLFNNMSKLTKSLERISKHDSIGYYKFLSKVYEKYIIADTNFLKNSFSNTKDFINLNSLKKILEINTFSTAYDYISKYINNEKLRNLLAFQAFYVGISPFEGPNIYNLIPTISQLYGLWYIEGGMYSYVKALEKLIVELGGKIITNTTVNEIVIQNRNAIGVKTSLGFQKSDIVICDADFPYAVNTLIKDRYSKGKYTEKKISNMEYSCSTFIMYIGLKKKYPCLNVHNLYIGENFNKNLECAFIGKLPLNPSMYIYCPSSIDNSMANEHMESLNIMVRVPNTLFKNIKWNEKTIKLMRNRIFNELSKIDGLSDIKENILYENYLTPNDLLIKFNSYGGTAFGLSPTLSQTNFFRPHVKSPTVNNLYFVGNSVHPGAGISIVLLSSKLAVEEILYNK